MSGAKFTALLIAGTLWMALPGLADTQNAPQHRLHKAAKKQEPPAPLPSGPQGPVPQVPLDAMPAVPPQVTYQDGLLTIVAPNSTLADILRGVRKHTSADIEVPNSATERVVTRLGPAPAREVMAELLNGSKFNYILLGSPEDANSLVRVVLVPKTPDTPATAQPAQHDEAVAGVVEAEPADADNQDDNTTDDSQDQNADADQQSNPDQPAVKTPQQMLQEMQQRQLQMQQQQQGQQPGAQPPYFPGRPGVPMPPQQQPQQNQ
jgi:hypothetical protein